MKFIRVAATLLPFLLWSGCNYAHAQGAPAQQYCLSSNGGAIPDWKPCGSSNPMSIGSGFIQSARAPDLSASNSSSNVALGVTGTNGFTARVCNTGGVSAYVALGGASVTVSTSNGIFVGAGACINLSVGTATNLAGITASSTTTLQTSLGYGLAALGGSGGGAGTSPGGSSGQVQYNNAGAFGGISGWTTDGANTLTGAASTTVAIGGATIGSNALAAVGPLASFGATTTAPGFYAYLNGDTVARATVGLDTSDNPRLAFGSGSATRDTFLMRDAANILAQRNGTTAQVFRVYNTFTDASNYERAVMNWSGNILTVGTEKAGTGVTRNMAFIVGGGTAMTIQSNQVVMGGIPFLFGADNSNDIGASGANRPRTGYFGTSVVAPSFTVQQTPTAITQATTMTFSSAADSASNIGHRCSFNMNGTTYWFPCSSVAF